MIGEDRVLKMSSIAWLPRPETCLDRDVARDTMSEAKVAPHPKTQCQVLLDPLALLQQTRFVLQVVESRIAGSMQGNGASFVPPPPAIDDTSAGWSVRTES